MGIQINGTTDTISATDGGLVVSGQQLTGVTNLQISGITTVGAGSTSAPSITPTGDSNTGIFFPTADTIAFVEGGVESARFDSNGRFGLGTATVTGYSSNIVHLNGSTGAELHITTGGTGTAQSDGLTLYVRDSDGTAGLMMRESNALTFGTNDNERARIDSSGRLLVGTPTSAAVSDGEEPFVQVKGTDSRGGLSLSRFSNDAQGCGLYIAKSRGTSIGSATIVASGDELGRITFSGSDGTDLNTPGASIKAEVDGTPGSNDMPGRIIFSTTADGASSPTERMRITSDGYVYIGKTTGSTSVSGTVFLQNYAVITSTATNSGDRCLILNRQSADGDLLQFWQADTQEGAVSVSGTTVTYGGGHLARWSQLPNAEDPSTLLKGTVLSNLDEMCEWGEEDNEQLNRTKVSDVEGDPNVAGVYVSASPTDDGPLDFWLAMTGDMIIRIAEGVTVQRGDLLMSAGDGTAKPQDDDIVRSKTIAKVTSNHVTCTYDDGSYCVPCVLMAC